MIDVGEWAHRYGPRVDSWRLPASQAKRDRLAQVYGADAVALLRAVFAADRPGLAGRAARGADAAPRAGAELPDHHRHPGPGGDPAAGGGHGRSPARQNRGSPPRTTPTPGGPPKATTCSGTATRSTSPRPATARTTGHRQRPRPTRARRPPPGPEPDHNVATTAATVPDVKATTAIHQRLHEHELLPARALPRLRLPLGRDHRHRRDWLRRHPGHPRPARPVRAGPRRHRLRQDRLHHRLRLGCRAFSGHCVGVTVTPLTCSPCVR